MREESSAGIGSDLMGRSPFSSVSMESKAMEWR